MLLFIFILSTFPILVFSDNKVYWCFQNNIFLEKSKNIFDYEGLPKTATHAEGYDGMI
jgi:hypothetical protein